MVDWVSGMMDKVELPNANGIWWDLLFKQL
jgi:hypothetical protein